jgi:hypothetical protein
MYVIVELVSAAPGPSSIPAVLTRKAKFGPRVTTRSMNVTRIAASRSVFISARTAAAPLRGTGCPSGRQQRLLGGDGDPNIYGITVGSFADPNFPQPTFSVWEEVMHPWLGVATATEHFPQGRPLTR